jgi:hypothetical protein
VSATQEGWMKVLTGSCSAHLFVCAQRCPVRVQGTYVRDDDVIHSRHLGAVAHTA